MSSLETRTSHKVPLSKKETKRLAKAEEMRLYAEFCKARDRFVYEWRYRHRIRRFRGESRAFFLLGGKKFDKNAYIRGEGKYKNGYGKKLGALEQAYLRALDAYIAAFAARKGESSARSLELRLKKQAILMERTYFPLHWSFRTLRGAGKAAKFLSDITGVSWMARKSVEYLKHHKKARLIAAGALLAALTAAGIVLAPEVLAAIAAAKTITTLAVAAGVGTRIGVGYGIPYLLSRSRYFQERPEKFAEICYWLGWTSWVGAIGVGTEIGTDTLGSGMKQGIMNSFHMDSPNETLRQTMRGLINHMKGGPTFVSLDSHSSRVLAGVLENASFSQAQKDPVFKNLYEALLYLKSQRVLLLDSSENKRLIAEGTALLKDLQILEEASARHGSAGLDPKLVAQSAGDLTTTRLHAAEWVGRFSAAAAAGELERHKNIFELAIEYYNTHPEQPLPPVSRFFDHDPTFRDLPITYQSVTPTTFFKTEDAIREHLQYASMVLSHYERVVSPSERDSLHRSLVAAVSRYRSLLNQMEQLHPSFEKMSQAHALTEGRGPGYGNLSDAFLLQRLREIDFSVYQSSWKPVLDAERLARTIPAGHTFLDGRVVPLDQAIAVKQGTFVSRLSAEMGAAINGDFQTLRNDGLDPVLTEGFKNTTNHLSRAHAEGRAFDFTFEDRRFTGEKIYKAFRDIEPRSRRFILEGTFRPDAYGNSLFSLRKAFKEYLVQKGIFQPGRALDAYVNSRIVSPETATAANFHCEPLNVEPTDNVPVT